MAKFTLKSNRQGFTKEDLDAVSEFQRKAGILTIGGEKIEGVKPADLSSKGEMIGNGGRAPVHRIFCNGYVIAAKTLHFSTISELKRIREELEILETCGNCPYIVQGYGFVMEDLREFQTTLMAVQICMEQMATCCERVRRILLQRNKTKLWVKQNFPEYVIGRIVTSVLRALDFLKQRDIRHDDIKLANILLGWEGNVKLCDFGKTERQEIQINEADLTGIVYSVKEMKGIDDTTNTKMNEESYSPELLEFIKACENQKSFNELKDLTFFREYDAHGDETAKDSEGSHSVGLWITNVLNT